MDEISSESFNDTNGSRAAQIGPCEEITHVAMCRNVNSSTQFVLEDISENKQRKGIRSVRSLLATMTQLSLQNGERDKFTIRHDVHSCVVIATQVHALQCQNTARSNFNQFSIHSPRIALLKS